MTQAVAIFRSMGGLIFDATFKEEHTSELEVTDNPVETGVVVSDHAYMKPEAVTISAGVSNTPLHQSAGDAYESDQGRVNRAFEVLKELQKKAEPFDVQTGLKLYKNMVVKSIKTEQDSKTANALIFTAELREVLIVSTETVKYTPRKAGATKQQADAKKAKGEQQGKEPDAKKSSILDKTLKAVTGK